MVFSSYIFIFAFLPTVLAGYYLLSKLKNALYQRIFLIIASLFFYGYFNIGYLLIIVSSIIVNYLTAKGIVSAEKQSAKKAGLVFGILFNVGLIGYFKYANFFVDNINAVFGSDIFLKKIVLPLGISFFTFQQLSFLVSVYKGEETVGRFRDYSLFVTFFPQLVAGPIVLYSEMMPQFADENRRYINWDNFIQGVFIFSFGLFKKAAIADTVSLFVDNGFVLANPGLIPSWVTALSYMMQIYFDFSGYSDMAVGLGKMFNIDLPFNFDSPYKSNSITEFWRRWHITLGRALSTYVYKPLGGNRKGLPRTCVNLMLTFLVSGLWHGASWTFVVWGGVYGLLTVLERIFKTPFEKIPVPIRRIYTFVSVLLLWVLFRADTFTDALRIYRGMFSFGNPGLNQLKLIAFDSVIDYPPIIDIAYIFGLLAVLCFAVLFLKNSKQRLERFKPNYKTCIICTVLFLAGVLCLSRQSVFIYFNF